MTYAVPVLGFLLDVALSPVKRLVCIARGHDLIGPWHHKGEALLACRRCHATWGMWP